MPPTTLARPIRLTNDDLDADPARWENVELYHGRPVEMSYVKGIHARILWELAGQIRDWIRVGGGLGVAYPGDVGFRLDVDTRYSCDLAWTPVMPEDDNVIFTRVFPLMVEIISDANSARDLDEKVEDYLVHGAREVWVIDPVRQRVRVVGGTGTSRTLRPGDVHVPGEWMPGFRLEVASLFEIRSA